MKKVAFIVPEGKRESFTQNMFFVWKFFTLTGYHSEVIETTEVFDTWKNFDVLVFHAPIEDILVVPDLVGHIQHIKDSVLIINSPDLRVWEKQRNKFSTYQTWGLPTAFPELCYTEEEISSYIKHTGSDLLTIFPVVAELPKKSLVEDKSANNSFEVAAADAIKRSQPFLAEEKPVVVQKSRSTLSKDGFFSLFFMGGQLSHGVKMVGGEPFRWEPDHDIVSFANYTAAATCDILVEKNFLFTPSSFAQMTYPFYMKIDFWEDNQQYIPFNISFFEENLFLLENPAACVFYVSELVQQIQNSI